MQNKNKLPLFGQTYVQKSHKDVIISISYVQKYISLEYLQTYVFLIIYFVSTLFTDTEGHFKKT